MKRSKFLLASGIACGILVLAWFLSQGREDDTGKPTKATPTAASRGRSEKNPTRPRHSVNPEEGVFDGTPPSIGCFRGRVVDAAGRPIPGVMLKVSGRSSPTTTDLDGRCSFQQDLDTSLVVGVILPGESEPRRVVQLTASTPDRAEPEDIRLAMFYVNVRVIVLNRQEEKILGASVFTLLESKVFNEKTNTDGEVTIGPRFVRVRTPGECYSVLVQHPDYSPVEKELDPMALEVAEMRFVLPPAELPITVSGVILDRQMKPVPGATIACLKRYDYYKDQKWTGSLTCPREEANEDGRFSLSVRLSSIQPYTFRLWLNVRADGFAPLGQEILGAVPGLNLDNRVLILDEGRIIEGHVRWVNGDPVSGADVFFLESDPMEGDFQFDYVECKTDEHGHYKSSSLGPGPYNITLLRGTRAGEGMPNFLSIRRERVSSGSTNVDFYVDAEGNEVK